MNPTSVENALTETARRVVELARQLGADQAEAGVSYEEGLSVTVRLGDIESVERQRDRGLELTVYKNQRKGTTSTNDYSERGVEDAVRKALSIASFTAPDPCAGLADAELMAVDPLAPDLYFPHALDVDAAAAVALRAEGAARQHDSRVENSEGATVSAGEGLRIYANSHGFVGGFPSSSYSTSCSVIAKGRNGSLERDYWYAVARDFADLEEPELVGTHAAQRAVQRLDARQVATKSVPVIYPAELARGLIGHFIGAIRGTSQYRKSTFLLDSCGQQIFPDFVDIEEDPFIARAMASTPFDGEGVATAKRMLVEGGVLQGYVLSSYSARRLGLATTANAGGVHNLVVKPTAGALDTLIADCDQAFVVGELLGQGVNGVTGDYSRGAAGFWVEGGEIAFPVNEVTIAGNLVEMFKSIRAIGSDVDIRGGVRTGSIFVDGLTVAGQ